MNDIIDAVAPKKKSTFKCPDCGSNCPVTSTKRLTDIVKEFYVSCSNDECGGRYVFSSEPVRILVPSLTPKEGMTLPYARNAAPRETARETAKQA